MTQVTLAEKLRYLRKSRRLSQAELAHRLGLTNNAFISHLERGTRRPSGPLLRKLADLLAYDYESLRALAGPPPGEPRQEELMPAPGADLTAKIRREVESFGDRLGELVGEALPEFLWSREQRLLAEGGSQEIWIAAPAIAHHGVEADLLAVAVSNLRRGARYRYLLSDQRESRIEAGRLLRRYQEALAAAPLRHRKRVLDADADGGDGGDGPLDVPLPEVAFVSRDAFPLVFEIALFDPRAGDRIRGTLLPPGDDPEWEVALDGGQARELARHFARFWSRTASNAGAAAG
ncbi:MAG TPA: helix-turn-helix transcriptional regulator [Candidatus Udaeobacter sp.]|nr:helix-turn-helix transcriptional regulator [Candidatus Udaeobacter sp.]